MKTPTTKPHFKKQAGYWSVYHKGRLVSSWPTIEAAWLRYEEYK